MKNADLDENREAEDILKAHEAGLLVSVPNEKEEIKRYAAYAKASIRRDRTVNLRMNSGDLLALQAKAAQAGMPYQTLLNTLVHKYVVGEVELSI